MGWFIDKILCRLYTSYFCVKIIYVSCMHLHTQTRTRAPQPVVGVPTTRSQLKAVHWNTMCCEATADRRKPGGVFFQREKFPGSRKNPKPCRENVRWGRLPPGGIGGEPGAEEEAAAPAQVFPPFGWDPGWGCCFPWARAFRKTMTNSERPYLVYILLSGGFADSQATEALGKEPAWSVLSYFLFLFLFC